MNKINGLRGALALVVLVLVSACYIPPRPLPNWKTARMQSGARLPCSGFYKGQRLGNGAKVAQVHTSYVVVRTRDRESVVIPCRVR
jgi:hypothetical protein